MVKTNENSVGMGEGHTVLWGIKVVHKKWWQSFGSQWQRLKNSFQK